MNNRGITTFADLMVGVALSSVVAFTAGRVVEPLVRSTVEVTTREKLDSSLAQMGQLIKSIGRTSTGCRKLPLQTLECDLAPRTPHNPFNAVSSVRFTLTAKGLEFQSMDGSTGNWTARLIVEGVSEFTLCDAIDMRNSECPITPSNISAAFAAFGPTSPNNFFRFQAVVRKPVNASGKTLRLEYQSSFSVRNGGSITYVGG